MFLIYYDSIKTNIKSNMTLTFYSLNFTINNSIINYIKLLSNILSFTKIKNIIMIL